VHERENRHKLNDWQARDRFESKATDLRYPRDVRFTESLRRIK